MNLKKIPENQSFSKIRHEENFFRYSFSSTRCIRFHGKRTEKGKVYFKIKDLINQGVTSTGDLALHKASQQDRQGAISKQWGTSVW